MRRPFARPTGDPAQDGAAAELVMLREENARLSSEAALSRPLDDAFARMRAAVADQAADAEDDEWSALAEARALRTTLLDLASSLERAAAHVRRQLEDVCGTTIHGTDSVGSLSAAHDTTPIPATGEFR